MVGSPEAPLKAEGRVSASDGPSTAERKANQVAVCLFRQLLLRPVAAVQLADGEWRPQL